ncbi:MAG: hypothetical protein JRJ87_05880 [Deltaproteobacteria bacterium]|nr:hypothetical protein [Deltaproteobacteria bacterium]
MKFRLLVIGLLLITSVMWMTDRPSEAVPAFARRHEFSCTTCHNPFPRLKAYGEEFAGNAFAPGDQEMPPRYFRDVGDDDLSLLKYVPLAVRADLYFDMRVDVQNGDNSSDFKVPWGLKLLSGGRIAEDIGYYFYFYMSERGEVAGVEDAYIHFNDLFGSPLDIMVGQFQVSDPLFKRELRMTFQDYLIYKVKLGDSQTDLTYDRGVMLTAGFDFGMDLYGIIVNGNGKGEADISRDFDMDKYKHFMLRISQSLGPIRIGLFGYYGKEELYSETDDSFWINELNMWGPDITLSLGRAELNVQYLQRRDNKPSLDTTRAQSPILTHGIIAEAIVDLLGDPAKIFVVLLFNWVDSDSLESGQEAYTANLTWMMHTNIKLLAEYTFARVVNGEEVKEHRATLGVVTGF